MPELEAGFFDLGVSPEPVKQTIKKVSGCEGCGLYKDCKSPKMELSGKGAMKILIIGEAPGRTEDENGVPFCGTSGQLLQTELDKLGIKMRRDCWITNAVICRPIDKKGNNASPTDSQVANCRPRLLKLIEDLKPKVILILGAVAVQSIIGHKTTGRLKGIRNTAFYGERIPDQDYNCWLIPTYHPAYLLRNDRDEVLYRLWRKSLREAKEASENDKILRFDPKDRIFTTEKMEKACEILDYIVNKEKIIAFDYETTGIKPQVNDHKIKVVSIATAELAWAFPFFHDDSHFIELWRRIMIDASIGKIAHKLDFEDAWTYKTLNNFIEGWKWDTCLAAHCLDSKKPTGLKFLSYCDFGIIGYDDKVEKYISGCREGDDPKSGNHFNIIDQAPMDNLLHYCAMDSFLSFKLYEKQVMKMPAGIFKGFEFFLQGAEALSHIQQNGWNVDIEWMKTQRDRLGKRMDKFEKKILDSEDAREWKKQEFKELNFNSNPQLDKLLYKILKYDRPGGPKTDEKALSNIGTPFAKNIVQYRKFKKLRDTYLSQYDREQVDGKIYPFFNLHIPATFRSSSDSPNFQNVPKRDKQAQQIIRSIIRPSPGNRLIEYDYKSLEVCISACYHKDPNMIKYIEDPSTDMHRDTGMDLFMRNKNELTKVERHCAKNGFVFPAFYGSTTDQIAPNIWEMAPDETKEHLKMKGINSFSKFAKHVEEIEEVFWGERFRVYNNWKRKVYKQYQEDGYISLHTGFRCYGPLKYTEATNYAIQGSAFHCLLWALTRSYHQIEGISSRSSIIGQIHDSIVADIHPEDEAQADRIINRNSTQLIRQHWPWIIVPLKVEKERSKVDGSWDEMEECELEL